MAHRYFPLRKDNIMTWTPAMSTFIFNKAYNFIKNMVSMDRGFIQKDLEAVVDDVYGFCGC
jgi:hypothetical protein